MGVRQKHLEIHSARKSTPIEDKPLRATEAEDGGLEEGQAYGKGAKTPLQTQFGPIISKSIPNVVWGRVCVTHGGEGLK